MIEHHINKISEETFNNHVSAAKCFPETDYSRGYIRGVSRLYQGEKFGTAAEHEQLLHLLGDSGDGYRDGFGGKMFDFTRIA
jgi:hypothetical protein